MTRSYRSEIRQLKTARAKLWRDLKRNARVNERRSAFVMRARQSCEQAALQIERRISILRGRLT